MIVNGSQFFLGKIGMGSCCMERVGSVSVCVMADNKQGDRTRQLCAGWWPCGHNPTWLLVAAGPPSQQRVPASSQSSGRSPSQTAVVTRPLLLQHPLPPVSSPVPTHHHSKNDPFQINTLNQVTLKAPLQSTVCVTGDQCRKCYTEYCTGWQTIMNNHHVTALPYVSQDDINSGATRLHSAAFNNLSKKSVRQQSQYAGSRHCNTKEETKQTDDKRVSTLPS